MIRNELHLNAFGFCCSGACRRGKNYTWNKWITPGTWLSRGLWDAALWHCAAHSACIRSKISCISAVRLRHPPAPCGFMTATSVMLYRVAACRSFSVSLCSPIEHYITGNGPVIAASCSWPDLRLDNRLTHRNWCLLEIDVVLAETCSTCDTWCMETWWDMMRHGMTWNDISMTPSIPGSHQCQHCVQVSKRTGSLLIVEGSGFPGWSSAQASVKVIGICQRRPKASIWPSRRSCCEGW